MLLEKLKNNSNFKLKGDYNNVKYYKLDNIFYKIINDVFVFEVKDEYELKMLNILN
jgi:hypothetical protein